MIRSIAFFAFTTVFAAALPASGQETRLSPVLAEAHLWTGVPGVTDQVVVPALVRVPGPPSSAWRQAFLAGYLFGGLGGLAVAKQTTLPRPVGLWLQGWYTGVAVSSDPSRLGAAAPSPWGSGGLPLSGGSSVLDGLMEGFFDVLDITGTRVR